MEQCRILIAAERCPRCLEDGKLVAHGLLLLVSLQPLAQTCVKPAHIVLVHGYAIDASVDRPHELREGRPVVGILGRRVADQGE